MVEASTNSCVALACTLVNDRPRPCTTVDGHRSARGGGLKGTWRGRRWPGWRADKGDRSGTPAALLGMLGIGSDTLVGRPGSGSKAPRASGAPVPLPAAAGGRYAQATES